MVDHLAKLRMLQKLVQEAVLEQGLDLDNFEIELDDDHNDIVKIRLVIKPEAVMSEEELSIDKEFANIMEGLGWK